MVIDDAVTLKKLEVFLAFMKLGNMARVSEQLSQSVVSVHRALHSLEEGIGCALFKLDGRKLIPLQTAYTFAEYAERALHECETGLRKTREVAGFAAPRLKIGALYSVTFGTMPELIVNLKLRRSGTDVELTLGSNRMLLELLSEGRLDAIIIALREAHRDEALVAVPLFEDEMFFAAPVNSRYARSTAIDLAALRDEKFVALADDFATAGNFQHAFEKAGFVPTVAMRVGDIFSLANLVGGGLGYSLLPGRLGSFSPNVRLIPLAAPYRSRQTITLLFPKVREHDPNLLALAAACRTLGSRT